MIFWGRKWQNWFFSNFYIPKPYNFISNLNDDFHEASFEVNYFSVSQKLMILQFLHIFFILTSVTSDTSWGQSMSLSDLYEVSNFSWICQLLYEVLFVEFRWKLKHPETTISHRALLDHPRILNWPKSPHRLGLINPNEPDIGSKFGLSRVETPESNFGLSLVGLVRFIWPHYRSWSEFQSENQLASAFTCAIF